MDSDTSLPNYNSAIATPKSKPTPESIVAEANEKLAKFEKEFYELFSAYVKPPSQGANNNTIRPCHPIIPMKKLESILKSEADRRVEIQKNIAQRKSNILRMQEASAEFRKEQEAVREKLREKGTRLEIKYEKVMVKIDKTEKSCKQIKKKCEELDGAGAFFEPLIAKLNLNLETMTCAEGLPIDPSGNEGSCNVWDCPRLQKCIPEKNNGKVKKS